METKLSKRILAFILVLVMLFTTLPLSIFAQEPGGASLNDDTVNKTPYPGVIEDENDLVEFPLTFMDASSSQDLESALSEGIDAIRITAGFEIDRTFFITSNTIIYSEKAVTLTRSPSFAGDIFVVGQNADGTLCQESVIFSLGGASNNDTGILTIDGNKDNMTVDVAGSVVFVCSGSQADLYENLVITNNKKVANERALDSIHGLSNTTYIGGAVAILAASSKMNIYGGTYSNNSVNTSGSSVYGGAFYNFATLNIYGGTIENNSAVRAGAIYNYRTARIYNAVIQNNTASTYGGAIYSPASTAAKLYTGGDNDICQSYVVFKSNTAKSGGGAVYFAGPTSLSNTLIEGNSAASGGALYASSKYGTLEIDSCSFVGNSATEKGGVVATTGHNQLDKELDLSIKNSTFTENTAASGGVAYIANLNVSKIENSKFIGNSSTSAGGVFYILGASATFNNVQLKGNSASNGAIYINDSDNGDFSNVTINKLSAEENISTGNGGAIYAIYTTLNVYNSSFKKNFGKAGSAMYLSTSVSGGIYGTSFMQNSCDETNTGNASALFIYTGGTEMTVHSCTFIENTSAGLGGAMTISGKSIAYLYNITAIGNSALKGGVLYETSASTVVTISGLTVSGNSATSGGAIIWGNTTNAKLYLNKANYIDLDIEGALPSDYWSGAIANALKVYDSDAVIPSYTDFGGEGISDTWSAVIVTNIDELEAAILAKEPIIKIASDIYVDRTLYIDYDAHIFSTTPCTVYRADGFTGSLIVVGVAPLVSEPSEGEEPTEPIIINVSLTLGGKDSITENLLVIDGAGVSCEKGIELLNGATLDIYKNVTVTNTPNTKGAINAASGATLNIHGITVDSNIAGEGVSGYGVIYNYGTTNIFGGTFTSNVSTYGGVIYNRGTLNISGGLFEGNTALRGGVLYNRGTLNISGGTFKSNTATENGGAILHYAGNAVINAEFIGNSAAQNAGALYLVGGTCVLNGTSFTENSAQNGGAIYITAEADASIDSITVTTNRATNGGGIYIDSNAITVNASRFDKNEATLGGAIYVTRAQKLRIKDSFASGNKASENGGFLYTVATTVTLTSNEIKSSEADFGGGIYLLNSVAESSANTFDSNAATEGGAIYAKGSTVKSNSDTFTQNLAYYNAGAVLLDSSSAYFHKVEALSNLASNDGGFAFAKASRLEIVNSSLKANTADMNGGAIAASENGEVGVYASALISNSAKRNGGAISSSSSGAKITVQLCTLTQNSAGNFGGVIYASGKSKFYVYSSEASSSSAMRGGVIYITDSETEATLNELTVSGNTATNGSVAYGNNAGSVIYINKENYKDAQVSNTTSAYFASAFAGKLTLKAIYEDAPEYMENGKEPSYDIESYFDVSNADQLEVALANREKYIRIVSDFEIDRTFYITYDVVIFSTAKHTLTRAHDFGSDIFVVGEYSDGSSPMPESPDSCLTMGNPSSSSNNLLIIDGNRDNMTVDVSGTVFFITNSARVKLYSGLTVVNCYKNNNERTHEDKYGLSRPNRIGGSLAIIPFGTLDIYGGIYSHNSSRTDTASAEENRLSTIGGLIYNESNLRIYDGLFEHNSGARGGIVYNYSTVKIYGGSFIENVATIAGGVYYTPSSASSHLNVGFESEKEILFKNNVAGTSGGVIYSSYLAGIVIHGNTVFENNVAITTNGGAINASSMLTVKNSTFIGNTAPEGHAGAIYLSRGSDNGVTRLSYIENCTFTGNEAGTGGALSLYSGDSEYDGGASTTIINSKFISNKASTGGAVSIERISDLTVKNSTFEGNESTSEGGVIYTITEGTVNIHDSVFSSNKAGGYGGAFSIRSSYFNVYNSVIENNYSAKNGGAFYVSYSSACEMNSSVYIEGSTIRGNESAAAGGAIYATRRAIDGDTKILTVKSTDFASNIAKSDGGAIVLTGSTNTYMSDVSFISNTLTGTSEANGGAIALWNGILEIDGAAFTKNSAKSGGAIFFENALSSVKLNNITATKNTARGSGGFLYGIDGEINLYNSSINANSASTGGAIYLYDGVRGGIYSTDFAKNESSDNGGALFIYTFGTEFKIHDCSFTQNVSNNAGGAMYVSGETLLGLYNTVAKNNTAVKGGFMYETKAGTVVYLSGLTLSGNEASSGGNVIWGNTNNADLFIDKSTVKDLDVQGALDDAYFDDLVENLLTVEYTTVKAPSYKDYAPIIEKAPAVTVKNPVSVDEIFDLAVNSSDGYIDSVYDKLPVLDNSSNFMSREETFFENINGETVTVDTFVYKNYAADGNMNVGQGLMIYQAMLYKQANPDEEVYIDIASYRFSVQTAVNINRNSRYFGYVRQLPGGQDYDKFGFVRISYLLISAAKMGIHVNVMGHQDAYPLTSSERLATYFTDKLADPCDPKYVKDGVIGDYMTFTKYAWTLGGSGGKGGTDMMHVKLCAVSHYLDMNGEVHKNAVWTSSSNLDGVYNSKGGYNANWKLQTATIISDHEAIYNVATNYLRLMPQYSGQEEIIEFQNYINVKSAEQIDLILEGRGEEVPYEERIVYVGSESDDVFEFYFTPFAGDILTWNEKYSPHSKYLRELYESEDYIIFTWNAAEYSGGFMLGQQIEQAIIEAFHKNKNPNNKIYANMESFDASTFDDLVVGVDIGYKSINEWKFGSVHNKDLQFSYVKNGVRYYVSLLNSCNFHSGSMYYQPNFALVIKETSCASDSVFSTVSEHSTTGNLVSHTLGETQIQAPTKNEHGYKYAVCEICGEREILETLHCDGEWVNDRLPTATENGIRHKNCTVCGIRLETQEIISAGKEFVLELGKWLGLGFNTTSAIPLDINAAPQTFEATIQLSPSYSGRGGVIFSNYGIDADNAVSLEIYTGGRVRLFFVNQGMKMDCLFSTDVRSNEKTAIAVTVNGTTASLYVNGELCETKKLSCSLPSLTNDFMIGGDHRTGNNQYFKGTIYSLSLFSDARTAAEIKEDYPIVSPVAQGLIYSKYFTKDGDNAIAGSDTLLDATDSFKVEGALASTPNTFEAVVYIPKTLSGNIGLIVGNYINSSNAINIEVADGGLIKLVIVKNGQVLEYTFATDIRSDMPVHIAVTLENGVAKLYVNGSYAEQIAITDNLPSATEGYYISGTRADAFNGSVYAVNLFADARTESEIKKDMILVTKNEDALLYSAYFTDNGEPTIIEGQKFSSEIMGSIGCVDGTPATFEALISAPSDLTSTGIIFNGYVDDSNYLTISLFSGNRISISMSNNGRSVVCHFKTLIDTDTPVHIAVTVSGSIARLYVNGAHAETRGLGVQLLEADSFTIGGDMKNGNKNYFGGTIYRVALFDDVRTAEEIAADAIFVQSGAQELIYSGAYIKPNGNMLSESDLHANLLYVIDRHESEADIGLAHYECAICGKITKYVSIKNGVEVVNKHNYTGSNVGIKPDQIYHIEDTFASVPLTYEALIQLSPAYKDRAGVIMGNYDASANNQINIEIYEKGAPRLYYKVGNVGYSYVFKTDIRSNDLTHIAITVDGMSAHLYVNGEWAETVTLTKAFPTSTKLPFCIGADNRAKNPQLFAGTIYSAAMFSDVRTAEEIKHDAIMVTSDSDNVLFNQFFVEAEDSESKGPWDGSSGVFVGDSITAGAGCSGDKYWEILGEALGLEGVTGMGVGGSCISSSSNYGDKYSPLVNRLDDIPASDLISIFMGTNDYGHDTPLGTIEDTTDVSFYGALNIIIPALLEKYPSSKIVFITPIHRYGYGTNSATGQPHTFDSLPNGAGHTLEDYVNAIIEVCAKYNVAVIDLYTLCDLDPSIELTREMYMEDGLHLNAVGHKYIASILEYWFNEIGKTVE